MSNRSLAARIALSAALLTTLPALGEVATPAPPLVADRATTRIHFDRDVIAGFGLAISPDVAMLELETVAPSGFVVDAVGPDFEGITSGTLRHASGFSIRSGDRVVALDALTIVPGRGPLALSMRDARGRELLTGDNIHFFYEPEQNRVRFENVDVLISPVLAAELGRRELAGIAIGHLSLEAATRPDPSEPSVGRGSCVPIWEGDVDVDLSELTSVQQIARNSGKVSVRMSTRLRNVGAADVAWYQKYQGFFAPYGTDQHPYLVWAMYRIAPLTLEEGAPTAITMLGQSALKHAFFATNQSDTTGPGCGCPGGHVLWSGAAHDFGICTDVYGTSNNDDARALGPRDELEAHSGKWTSTGSPWFDANADGICDWDSPSGSDTNGNDCDLGQINTPSPLRLAVLEADLETEGATYLFDSWYIVRDDVNIWNTMGWREILPSFNVSSWSFGFADAGPAPNPGSPLDAWVSRTSPPAGSSHVRLDTGVGELSLAARATDLGEGQWHYEYALHNHDFDRKVQSFRVPLPNGVTATNAVFRGLGNGGAADWTTSIAADAVTFTAPADANVNALDWGTLFSFGFDADAAPASGSVDLGALEQTPDLRFAGSAVTPGGALGSALFADDFESAGSARWSSTEG